MSASIVKLQRQLRPRRVLVLLLPEVHVCWLT